ncbi:hypothetical protein [Streptomyces sp. NPDC005485]|uniref:hypothetical protein n=1 Tax=Streptomyces sp. NPDC005485 TaxID=3155591 RepID=UPI0033B9E6F4
MQTTTPSPAPAPSPTPQKPERVFGRGQIVAVAVALAFVVLFALAAKGCESIEGGRVRSTEEFRVYVRDTTRTGEEAYYQLTPTPTGAPYAEKEGSSSCVDDFGFDDNGVTRDQPIFTWDLRFASTGDYRTAVKGLKATWKKQGHKVKDLPAPAPGEPGHGLPGITTTLDDGIEVTVHPGYYSGKPELRVEGACTRYDDTYGDSYDYMYDDNGDGTVDEWEKPGY